VKRESVREREGEGERGGEGRGKVRGKEGSLLDQEAAALR
jgi:hypothetical protein